MADYGFDTIAVRGGYAAKDNQESVAVPVYATAAFDFVSVERAGRLVAGEEEGFVYTRIGNPTNDVLERRIASLDGGVAAVSFGSGMAAISSTILAVTGGSGRILSTYQIYGGAFDLEKSIFPNLGIHLIWYPMTAALQSGRRPLHRRQRRSMWNPFPILPPVFWILRLLPDLPISTAFR